MFRHFLPAPSSRYTNCDTLVPKHGRKEGHGVREPRCWGGIGGAEEIGQQEVAETGQWLPEA